MAKTLRELLPDDELTRVSGALAGVLPRIDERDVWSAVPDDERATLLADAEEQAAGEWPVLLAGDFARFQREGDRNRYETPYFERRRRIVTSALAALLTGEERWVADV